MISIFLIQCNGVDKGYDRVLRQCIDSGLKEVISTSEYNARVVFNNNVEYCFWNANKYYGWLSKGSFYRNEELVVRYDESRPKRLTMYKFKKLLDNFDYLK